MFTATLFLMTMALQPSLAAIHPAAPQKAASRSHYEALVRREARGVYDLAQFVLPVDAPKSNASWVLAEVKPGPDCGMEVAETHEDPPGTFVADKILPAKDEGQIIILRTLTGRPLSGAIKYSWPSTLDTDVSDPAFDLWNPFTHGGKVIIRLAGERPLYREQPYYMVSEELAPSVPGAFAYAQQHPDLFSSARAAQNIRLLRSLLADKNPLLAVAAFRTLYRHEHIGSDDVLAILRHPEHLSSDDYVAILRNATITEQATEIEVLIDGARDTQPARLKKTLEKSLAQANTTDQLYGLALGLYAASDRLGYMPSFEKYRKTFKRQASWRMRSLNDTSETGKKLAATLRLMPS